MALSAERRRPRRPDPRTGRAARAPRAETPRGPMRRGRVGESRRVVVSCARAPTQVDRAVVRFRAAARRAV